MTRTNVTHQRVLLLMKAVLRSVRQINRARMEEVVGKEIEGEGGTRRTETEGNKTPDRPR